MRADLRGTPLSAFDLVEGFHVAHAFTALARARILQSLQRPRSVRTLAAQHRVDGAMLESVLDLLAHRTGLIARQGGSYRLTRRYDSHARFLIHQYLGAYGRNAVELDQALRAPGSAQARVDREQHARAFEQVCSLGARALVDVIIQLDLNHVLDLGCGSGILLRDVAIQRPRFVGWGLDCNPWMCTVARKCVATARTGRRVRILQGDCRRLTTCLPLRVRTRVRTIAAANLINEFFAGAEQAAVDWLKQVKAVFPRRTLLIADYYCHLGDASGPFARQIALHDFVQSISGQGLPPGDLRSWKEIYAAAGCFLIHAAEITDQSLFVHVVNL